MKKLTQAAAICFGVLISGAAHAGIIQIDPADLTGTELIDFDDIAGGPAPGTNYDTTFESGGASFGERFAGQTVVDNGGFDVIMGSPGGVLTVAAGAANQNLNVFDFNGSNVLTGLGSAGFPDFGAIGEGSFAVLFDFDQSEFGFDLVGGDGGSATLDFYARDGSLLDSVVVNMLSNQSYAFMSDMGFDIAGLVIHNMDGGGIGFDNLRHDVPNLPVPEPAGVLLVSLGLLLMRRLRK